MHIDFLYFDDCPSHVEALRRLREALSLEGIDADVDTINIGDDDEAARWGFRGSPTILVDGQDIDAAGAGGQAVALTCRVYHTQDGRITPLPPMEMIRSALRRRSETAGREGG